MFNTFKNMDGAFRQMRIVSIGVILACVLISTLAIYLSLRQSFKAGDRIYILANGRAVEAVAADRKENLPVEARDHIRVFHELFFSLEPDEKVISTNTGRAFYLADASAKRLYDNIREAGYFAGIISGNMSQSINVDSVELRMDVYPFYFRCFATEKIVRATVLTTRSLVTEGWLRNTLRSENNAHGFLIERLQVVENKNLKIENRGL